MREFLREVKYQLFTDDIGAGTVVIATVLGPLGGWGWWQGQHLLAIGVPLLCIPVVAGCARGVGDPPVPHYCTPGILLAVTWGVGIPLYALVACLSSMLIW